MPGRALNTRFAETRAACVQQALEIAFLLGRRLRELDLGSETGARNTSKAETALNAFSKPCKMHFWCLENKLKHFQYDFRV